MKTVLPGAAIGLLGGGENSRMFALAARRMGFRVHVYSPDGHSAASPIADVEIHSPYEDLDRVRAFASAVEVVTVAAGDVPASTLAAAADVSLLRPSAGVLEATENGFRASSDATIDVEAEFSIIGARGSNGECAFYAPIAIDRVNGVPDIARSPAAINGRMARQAVATTRGILEQLDLTGIACVEFLLTRGHELLVNCVTPHPHSSGHLTIDSCVTSQFEQQLRAVCGLPLGSTEMLRSAAMANLWDELWENGEPDWASACALPEVKLHLYGLPDGLPGEPGRSRGHLTATATSATLAKQIVRAARARLTPR